MLGKYIKQRQFVIGDNFEQLREFLKCAIFSYAENYCIALSHNFHQTDHVRMGESVSYYVMLLLFFVYIVLLQKRQRQGNTF